jgi:hypothetical protein
VAQAGVTDRSVGSTHCLETTMLHPAELDGVRRIVLPPVIVRAFWSKRCAWHGDLVRLHVETRNVPDGTPIAITLFEDDSEEGNADDLLGALEGTHEVRGNKWIHEYTLEWNADALGGEIEGDTFEFCFEVSIDRYGLRKRSTRLYVPIEPFVPSK